MPRALLLISFLPLVALPAVDGGRHVAPAGRVENPDSDLIPDDPEPDGSLTREELATEVILDEEPENPYPDALTPEEAASLLSQNASSSYTPNTGCRGRIEYLRTIDSTREGCGDRFEVQMADPEDGPNEVLRAQPPHDGWFMAGNGRRRRHRWYCGSSQERTHCGSGNCMKVGYNGRRRFKITCGSCTCHPPAAVSSTVCLQTLYSVAGGSGSSTVERTLRWSVGTSIESFQSSDLVREASASASASIDGMIPQLRATFGVSGESSVSVMSALHSAFGESQTTQFEDTEVITVVMDNPTYIYHAEAVINFEDGSSTTIGGRGFFQETSPLARTCTTIPLGGAWTRTPNAAIPGHNTETLTGQTIDSCKTACIGYSWCKSFDWNKNSNQCDLSNSDASDVGGLRTNYAGNPYDHYHCDSCGSLHH